MCVNGSQEGTSTEKIQAVVERCSHAGGKCDLTGEIPEVEDVGGECSSLASLKALRAVKLGSRPRDRSSRESIINKRSKISTWKDVSLLPREEGDEGWRDTSGPVEDGRWLPRQYSSGRAGKGFSC